MSDDVTEKRKDRMEKLELLQELYFILHRNCLEAVDRRFKHVIDRRFVGRLELLIEHDEPGWRREDLRISLRLLSPEQAERPGSVTFPVEAQALVDMYERLKPEEAKVLDGPEENVTYFDASKGEKKAP